MAAEANVDFENENNFDAYSAGNGKIHVKVLLFSERGYDHNAGRGNNQSLGNNPAQTCLATGSRLHTKRVSDNVEAIYLHYWADNYYNNTGAKSQHQWPKDKGVVWVQLWGGVIECTNTYDGIKRTIVVDGTVQQIEVKREDKSNHLTWFEFDWYPPEELDDKDFRLYVTTDHHQWNGADFKTKTYDFNIFTGADPDMAPTITEPFFYASNENGPAGYGKLAMVYTSMTDVSRYYTSHDATQYMIAERADMFFVQPEDTVKHGLRACFYSLRSVDNTTWRWVWSNRVDVPAYHKLHNLQSQGYTYYHEGLDRWYADYRYKCLTWEVHYPQEEDVLYGDGIEIERAYHSDFSDAESIGFIPLEYDSATTVNDIQTYTYVDSTEAAWWNPVERSYNIYYRIRRASSSVWGWEGNPYTATTTATVPKYKDYIIQNFGSTAYYSYSYRKAPDFNTTREVILTWPLYNGIRGSFTQEDPGYLTRYWDPKQKLMLRKIMLEQNDTILIEIPQDSIIKALNEAKYSTDPYYYNGTSNIYLTYTDRAYTPCTHYKYETYIDTTGILVKDLSSYYAYTIPVYPMSGTTLYYTDAANINTFSGSEKEYSEYVLLTWEPTEGDVGTYSVETRPNNQVPWTLLAEGLTQNWYKDTQADPTVTNEWEYQLKMSYECNGTTRSDVANTTGSRNPYGKISGRIAYADGTGCPNIEVNVSRVSDGAIIQRVLTNENGNYLLDSVLYCGDAQYAVTPVSQAAEFRYNNTSATFAPVTLSLDHSVAQNIDFENISSVRVSGRVLYENSTIPVRDANFLINGKLVQIGGNAYKTDASGNFEFAVPKGEGFTLQAVKEDHRFASEGFVRMEGDSLLTLTKALDGIRIYDQTKVRLIGRLAGGDIQGSKPLGHGLSTNYLGDDLKMVFELEGDNISQIVHLQNDPERDTLLQTIDSTRTLFEKKRITVYPDRRTGEYAVDIFPVRYKITQATARGYATLFGNGKTSETLDLSNAAHNDLISVFNNDTVHYNESYSITYHNPINISCTQLRYGMEVGYYGEETMRRKNIKNEQITVPLVFKDSVGAYTYLFGAPVFAMDNYSFRITAHEDYYYNNNPSEPLHEEVRIKGGTLKVYNGLYNAENTKIDSYQLDDNGQKDITIPVNYVSFMKTGENAIRVLDLSVEYRGQFIESQPIRAYVTGNKVKGRDFVASTHGDIVLLDILRDPPGSQSYSFIEEGTNYSYNYTYDFDFKFGLELTIGRGNKVTMSLGSYAGMGGGAYAGYVNDFSTELTFDLPITSHYTYKKVGHYIFTTANRIETDNEKYFVDQTGNGKYFVGQQADVYIGAKQNFYYGITEAVKPIDSLTYASLMARVRPDDTGTLRVIAQARDSKGKLWYLVIGEETEVGSYLNSTFIYTHDYVEHTLLPQLAQRRDNLLLTCDSITAQQIANATHKPTYWSKVLPTDSTFAADSTYVMLTPVGNDKVFDNEVAALNREMVNWIDVVFLRNEEDKVNAIYGTSKQKVGTFSISGGTKLTHTETYEYGNTYTKRIDYPGGSVQPSAGIVSAWKSIFGKTVAEQVKKLWEEKVRSKTESYPPFAIVNNTGSAHMIFDITPIIDINSDFDPSHSTTHTKKTGFVLETDNFGHESVSVYRVINKKDAFNSGSEDTREFVTQNSTLNLSDNTPDSLYGSYVFFLEGGASRCPYEPAYTTASYEPALLLSAGTLNLENQKIDINVHERSNVPADQPAIFTLRLSNESEGDFGGAALPITFYLKQKEGSNPHGARLMMDGMPITGDGRAIKIAHNEIITKTLQVYAGEGYDYENIVLELASPCDPFNKSACTFSVHYLPVSCPVNITAPHDKWVMNTLSSQDSVGYYLPVVIDGFDVNYNGFDHIEFQYKLSTQSDDAWVNQCSYYYSDSLYKAASGNKAMITSGRIENIRFYGERDPMEQQYDLRAVSYCRYGNGFVTRSSAVLSGTKDTRPPRVFGQPEPADAILGVGDNLKLRFNEAIAGNYLDEDNNFQLMGITNETGITTGAALVFEGNVQTCAETKANRSLSESFTLDMLVKPTEPNSEEVFFMHGSGDDLLLFGKSYDNRLSLAVGFDYYVNSERLSVPMTDFTRVIVTYDHETGAVRFFAGTQEVTKPSSPVTGIPFVHKACAPLNFGAGLIGSILEARIWTKALTPAEIANTHMKYLTGFERELLAYYPMNEGQGTTLTDKANGATLFVNGATWRYEKGISLHIPATDSVELAGDLMARSSIHDESFMCWVKTTSENGNIFSAASGFRFAIENGNLVMYNGDRSYRVNRPIAGGEWHHLLLTVDRAHNDLTLYVDEDAVVSESAANFGSISGRMFLGGRGFEGNIDEIAIFEQALPKTFVEGYGHISPYGDEMGLMAYLPFQQTKENESGIMELVFSVNDQRQFKTSAGDIIEKQVPLVIARNGQTIADMADKTASAPVRSQGMLTKLFFDWSFNNDELMINILNKDREVNKQTVYVTVRDVEDMNGNPMASPVMWTAFVDRNSLKWEDDDLNLYATFGAPVTNFEYRDVEIINRSGKRHQFAIESLPDWLSVDQSYGSINPLEDKFIRFYYNPNMPVGKYMDVVYLTDENGLSEPLEVEYTVEALPPYEDVNTSLYPLNMSVCGLVKIGDTYDTDPQDIVYAIFRNESVGMAHPAPVAGTLSPASTAELYITIYGSEQMNGKNLTFHLWQASTGKTLILSPSRAIQFKSGDVIGCGNDEPVVFTTSGSETQIIEILPGWNWVSTNLDLKPETAALNQVMMAATPWKEGDLIKNPATRQFCTYSEVMDAFMGTLSAWDYSQIYMVYAAAENQLRLNGDPLHETRKQITLRGDGAWTAFPCLLSQGTPTAEALADYYSYATPGDILKGHNRFAVFSSDGRWVGDLTGLRPGEGFLFRRMGPGDVTIRLYDRAASAPSFQRERTAIPSASNMTMIARLSTLDSRLHCYVDGVLAGVATPVTVDDKTFFFLTIQSDRQGTLRFETANGVVLQAYSGNHAPLTIQCEADSHHGSLEAPVLLEPCNAGKPYKILENQHVVIIRNNEKYDVTGKKL